MKEDMDKRDLTRVKLTMWFKKIKNVVSRVGQLHAKQVAPDRS